MPGRVVSRAQLAELGVSRWVVEAQAAAGRWHPLGRHALFVLDAAVSPDPGLARRWWAVFEVGGQAALDGVSALKHAGRNVDQPSLGVSVAKSGSHSAPGGVRVYETRRRAPDDLAGRPGDRLPCVRPATAAVRGALWATSNRQAALIMIMSVQQRLTRTAELAEAFERVRRHRRRSFLLAVLADLADGVQSMGELDFARLCRHAGLPEPDRQVERSGRSGRVYLDAYWDAYGVVVEIEGVLHEWESQQIGDTLRQNDLTVADAAVLRIPVVGLREASGPFLAQLAALLSRRGWRRPALHPWN